MLTLTLQRCKTPAPNSVLDMTLKYLMVRLNSWNSGEYGVLLHAITPRSTVSVAEFVRIQSIGQIEVVSWV